MPPTHVGGSAESNPHVSRHPAAIFTVSFIFLLLQAKSARKHFKADSRLRRTGSAGPQHFQSRKRAKIDFLRRSAFILFILLCVSCGKTPKPSSPAAQTTF